ncbi:MAG: thermonuclease family protein [Candidatus Adiutrix sp.]|nr:thermonuclease family protein [Candidatus Adiutrix sp.]
MTIAVIWWPPALLADEIISARVVQVRDGDTLTAVRSDGRVELLVVRLYGIDAPEADQPHGRRAAARLRRLVDGEAVRIEIMQERDRYGRVVGIVKLVNRDAGRALVAAGLAWVEPRYCKRPLPCRGYQTAEHKARRDRLGLWRGSEPVPPWVWR